ncbi:MAG: 50S ribosomal protein L21 [Candidatus Harrisonbacteria bacterium RIFCSPLOWO2_02_FULL_41_13b]|uniref:Large ribosomal subunit protein bL21 n=1 Tax=Candidatus Harrisonbacteria bacterium RIFCSPLOWO2_02_FULL_41_13b TaxID=1798409 RepID=A0A1G1ZQ80_9BACT|nr:MAG: 50S ribosomal protein L21 [Candidatus Harrisonbacteria bacterium RIFCSPHIGHO2_02_FULL_40_20]OGY66853.1 MAG: 50S ribosomal protein L21 [Candidatus Harrisonbacteria bacterium RIFCSPLOWO2_02_FULL_41_13b]
MFAIIETGGKQYRVTPGQKLKVEKLEAKEGEGFVLDKVLLTADGENVKVGNPYVTGVTVETKISRQGRARKVIVFKYHSKTRQKKKKGHRQSFTELEVVGIK